MFCLFIVNRNKPLKSIIRFENEWHPFLQKPIYNIYIDIIPHPAAYFNRTSYIKPKSKTILSLSLYWAHSLLWNSWSIRKRCYIITNLTKRSIVARRGESIRKRTDGRWEGRFIKGRKSDRTAIWGGHLWTFLHWGQGKTYHQKTEVQHFALNAESPTSSELSLTWESSIFRCQVTDSRTLSLHTPARHFAVRGSE